jgi:hypothetical protein
MKGYQMLTDEDNTCFYADYDDERTLPCHYQINIENEFEIFQEILNELFLSGESSVEHQPIMQKFIQIGMKSYLNELVEARKMRG